MAVEILLPQVGATMQQGQVSGWAADDGARVTEGGPLFSIEHDGHVHDIASPATGTLKINAARGATYAVGTVLGYIE